MKFSCSKDELMNALNICQKAVSTKTSNPLLEGILFKSYDQTLLLRSTNLEIGIQIVIDADVAIDGEIVIKSSLIGELIRKLSGSEVFIETNSKNQVKIDCLMSNFTIKGLEADEYPQFPEVIDDYSFSVDADVLKDLIRGTIFAVAVIENIPVLTGVKVEISDNNINLIAMDGYRLAFRTAKLMNALEEPNSVIIPSKSLSEIAKVIAAYSGEIVVKFSKNQIFFEMDRIQFTSRLLEGDFIDYKQIIPSEKTSHVKINRKLLIESSERAALLAREGKNNLIKLDFNQEQLILTSNAAEIGDVFEVIPIINEGEAIKIAFNSKYLIEALKAIEEEDLIINMTTSVGPGVLLPQEGSEFVYLILPVRVAE